MTVAESHEFRVHLQRTKISCGGRRDGFCNELDLGEPTDKLQMDKGAWIWDHTKPKYDSWPRMAKLM